MKKDLLSLLDLEKEDFDSLFARAIQLKKRYAKGIVDRPLVGRTMGLIFDKKSTRTRVSFETAMVQLGGHSIYMSAKDTQISRNEPAKDTARVLSRYIDCLVMRTFDHTRVEEFAKASTIPVINALTDSYHPCQILSDIMTVIECKGGYEGLKIAWVGDGNNVLNSWINAAAVLGLDISAACPEGYQVKPEIIEKASRKGKLNVTFTKDPRTAVENADVVYTDVWASMGDEAELSKRIKAFQGYQVNKELLEGAKPDVMVMHCLPAHRGEEISEEVLEGDSSVVWDQAENKRHMHKAILERLILGN
ncbi:MAG: ornithine carbamoyltransferase [Proteobacteria bacterium]|nr:ornithine carbamoyltransferase [Pseudomonadota bacterium]MBU1388804.1 ornithine carbamoyltransferase [Pseudomonadota bacterium]MBU1543145.1 ornithine carbamoyltransferase [Pseudomonadota bacterium]MBU2430243.1 ornithine carbamoyltransferase [Pseudomonadota bacterium]MBU2482594.1 ornithine carbamoyltransferase [Pseudomonadota bacterium]